MLKKAFMSLMLSIKLGIQVAPANPLINRNPIPLRLSRLGQTRMTVNESWQSRISTAGNLSFTLKK